MNTTLPTLALAASPVNTTAATTYTDLNALAGLQRDPTSPEAINGVASQVEALFLQMMLKSMREATASDDPDSNEMGMYQDMFDKQIALTMSQHQDLGLGSLLTRQMGAAGLGAAGLGAAGVGAARAGQTASPRAASVATPLTASLTDTADEFVAAVLPPIRLAAQTLGLDPLALLAQAALETGWGTRMARTADGKPSMNLFGIKADDAWEGARAAATTVEFAGGVATARQAVFRAYPSIQDSVNDFTQLLKNSARYRQAAGAGGDAQAYINGIGRSGYATDPAYASKLTEILHSNTLRAALKGSKL